MSSPSREWRSGVSPRFYLIVLCFVWIKRIRSQGEFKILLCSPSGGNLLLRQSRIRILLNIGDGALLRKQPTALTCWLLPQKSPITNFQQDSKCGSDRRCCECEVMLDFRCMYFVAAGWCARKWVRLYQTIRNKKFYFWWYGKSELKTTRVVYLLEFLRKEEKRGSVI